MVSAQSCKKSVEDTEYRYKKSPGEVSGGFHYAMKFYSIIPGSICN